MYRYLLTALSWSVLSAVLSLGVPLAAPLSAQGVVLDAPEEISPSRLKDLELPPPEKYNPDYWSYNFRYINDMHGSGFALNMDDLYTYGIAQQFSIENFDFNLDYRVLTDRYVSKTRVDYLQLSAAYRLGNLLDPYFWNQYQRPRSSGRKLYRLGFPFYLGLRPTVGFLGVGNLLGQQIQNQLHSITLLPALSLSYQRSQFLLLLGGSIYLAYTWDFGLQTRRWKDARLELGLELGGSFVPTYREDFKVGLHTRLVSGNQYYHLGLYLKQLGYFNERGASIETLWSDTQTAFWFHFSSRLGMFERRVDVSFGSLPNPKLPYAIGIGSLEFSISSLARKKVFREADISQSLLIGVGNGLLYDRSSLLTRIADRLPVAFSLVTAQEVTGDPRLFGGNALARKSEGFFMFFADLRPSFQLGKRGQLGRVELYSGLGLGLLMALSVDSLTTYGGQEAYQFFTLGAQAGIRWYGLRLRRDGAVYGVEAALLGLLPLIGESNSVRFPRSGLLLEGLRPSLSLLLGVTILADL